MRYPTQTNVLKCIITIYQFLEHYILYCINSLHLLHLPSTDWTTPSSFYYPVHIFWINRNTIINNIFPDPVDLIYIQLYIILAHAERDILV